MAYRCFKLAVTTNNDHAEAYNNIGVLEWRRGRGEQVSMGWGAGVQEWRRGKGEQVSMGWG